jgi:hypothetical protein
MAEAGRLLAGKSADVAAMSIKPAGGAELSFVREGKAWSISDGGLKLPVDPVRVESFLDAVAAVNRLSICSDGGELSAYGLDGAEASVVVLKSDKGVELASFSVGRTDALGKALYVKLAPKPAVYSVEAGFDSMLKGGRSAWLDLRLSANPAKVEDVQSISVDSRFPTDLSGKPAKSFAWTASRKDGGWSTAGETLDAMSVESTVRTAINLEASDIALAAPADAFAPVLARVELSLGSGKKSVIEIGKSAGPQSYYLRTPDSPWTYTVSAYSLGNIMRPEEALRKK